MSIKSILTVLFFFSAFALILPNDSFGQTKKKAKKVVKKQDSEYVPDEYVPEDYVPDDVPEAAGKNNMSTKPKTTTTTTTPGTKPPVVLSEAKDTASKPDADAPLDDIVNKKLTENKLVLAYEPLHERDILWQRRIWRVIDCRQKMNLPFMYNGEELFTILKKGIEKGELKSYSNDNFWHKQTTEDINSQLFKADTAEVYDPETGTYVYQAIRDDIDPQSINQFRIKEDWYFDSESSVMKVRILGIAPMIVEIDKTTLMEYPPRPVFWIYYPDARKFLSQHRVFNEDNIASPISWDDLFEMRRFESYIVKRSNVNDYRLKDYPEFAENGVDRLLESDKVKEEIFNFEHDLWSY